MNVCIAFESSGVKTTTMDTAIELLSERERRTKLQTMRSSEKCVNIY
jgi:hypothetical protein